MSGNAQERREEKRKRTARAEAERAEKHYKGSSKERGKAQQRRREAEAVWGGGAGFAFRRCCSVRQSRSNTTPRQGRSEAASGPPRAHLNGQGSGSLAGKVRCFPRVWRTAG